jgi:NTE family protein
MIPPAAADRPRVGLVLGAGGVLGGAWLVGALHALASETGWDPGSADNVVGTSAGAMVGALLASGIPPWFMVAHSAGEDHGPIAAAQTGQPSEADRSAGAVYRLHRRAPSIGPGSWSLALGSLARPYRYAPATLMAGWLPKGLVSTEPLKDTVRRACPEDWAPHPGFWAVACDYQDGRRTVFGRADAPPAQLADAVAASCAIPGFYHPVEIGGREYVDGGLRSTSNLDVLCGAGCDLVIALNPMSSLHAASARTLGERVATAIRATAGRRLGSEARRVREDGADVVLLQPSVHDLDAMGTNLMSARRRHQVLERAAVSVTEHLRASGLGAELAGRLPAGIPALVRRPRGPAARWPDFRTLAAERHATDLRRTRASARASDP